MERKVELKKLAQLLTLNSRLTKTAGVCCSGYKDNLQENPLYKGSRFTRSARIQLSTKVLDSADRLRDTMIHEMCHAASWIVSGYNGHGSHWIRWTKHAMERFPELPIIGERHSYPIKCKYTYRCVGCGYSVGRHTRSLDTSRKVCGHCRGNFELVRKSKQLAAGINDAGAGDSPTSEPPS